MNTITDFYLSSRDYNGISLENLGRSLATSPSSNKKVLKELIGENKISLNFGHPHPNPHIKAFEPEPKSNQFEKLNTHEGLFCIYPTKEHLANIVNKQDYYDRPITYLLKIGEPQFSHLSFDLSVLEIYRNDPRYYYKNDDVAGTIYVSEEYTDDSQLPEKDRIFLDTFGFSYNEKFERAVAVYLRYLSHLSPDHQIIWYAKKLDGVYKLHPDYFKQTMGSWDTNVSIFIAFLEEQKQINKMCEIIGFPKLFRKIYASESKPRDFGFLIRPTLKEFNNFIHILDKLISENINHKFFFDESSHSISKTNGKSTLKLLEEWLRRTYQTKNEKLYEDILGSFRKVRKLRQRPAHKIDDDIFDQKYFQRQRQMMKEVSESIQLLRLVFSSHPKTKDYKIPDWLYEGKICNY